MIFSKSSAGRFWLKHAWTNAIWSLAPELILLMSQVWLFSLVAAPDSAGAFVVAASSLICSVFLLSAPDLLNQKKAVASMRSSSTMPATMRGSLLLVLTGVCGLVLGSCSVGAMTGSGANCGSVATILGCDSESRGVQISRVDTGSLLLLPYSQLSPRALEGRSSSRLIFRVVARVSPEANFAWIWI